MSDRARLEASLRVRAPLEVVFDKIADLEKRARDMPTMHRVEIVERNADGFVATMHEHYGGRDVVVTSRFHWERPRWISYEHLESPYGANRGRFTLTSDDDGTLVHHVHETEDDVSKGTELREQWLALMDEQLDAIRRGAEQRR